MFNRSKHAAKLQGDGKNITLLRQEALWLATGRNGLLGFAGFRKDSTCVARATPAKQVAPRLAAGCFTIRPASILKMMKSIFWASTVWVLLSPFSYGLTRQDILFYADFDSGAVTKAQISAGSSEGSISQWKKISGYWEKASSNAAVENISGVESCGGKMGKGVLLKSGASISWKAESNYFPQKGTVEFWVKPKLLGKQTTAQPKRREGYFFKTDHMYMMYKDRYELAVARIDQDIKTGDIKDASLFFTHDSPYEYSWRWPNFSSVVSSLSSWTETQWHHVLITWDQKTFRMYIDGDPIGMGTGDLTASRITDAFQIGPFPFDVEYDEFYIYGKRLSNAEIINAYEKTQRFASDTKKLASRCLIPRVGVDEQEGAAPGHKVPDIDGVLSEGEWDITSSQLTHFISALTGELASRQMKVRFCYGTGILYIAFEDVVDQPFFHTPAGKGDVLSFKDKDGKEIIGINPDSKGAGDNGIKYASNVKDSKWQGEISMPLSLLGKKDEQGEFEIRVNRTYTELAEETSLGYTGAGFTNKTGAILRFAGNMWPSMIIKPIGQFDGSTLDLSFNIATRSTPWSEATVNITGGRDGKNQDVERVNHIKRFTPFYYQYIDWPMRHCDMKTRVDSDTCRSVEVKIINGTGGVDYACSFPFSFSKQLAISTVDGNLDQKMELAADISGYLGYGPKEQFNVSYRMFKEGTEEEVLKGEIKEFKDGIGRQILDIGALKKGRYVIRAVLKDADGLVLEKCEKNFEKWTDTKWEDVAKLGMPEDDEVLPPWSPIIVKGDQASCWAKMYDFGNSVLPEKIVINEKPMLAGPMKLAMQSGGVSLKAGKAGWEKKNNSEVVRTQSYGEGKNTVLVKTSMEYDGFIWITIDPAKCESLNNLTLEVRLNAGVAKLWSWYQYSYKHSYQKDKKIELEPVKPDELKGVTDPEARYKIIEKKQYYGNELNEDFPDVEKTPLEIPFTPVFWIHNDQMGFQYLADRYEGWNPGDYEKAISIRKEGGSIVLTFNIIGRETTGNALRKIELGFMTTPCRPLMDGWRKYRWGKGFNGNVWMWPSLNAGYGDGVPGFVYLRANNEEVFRNFVMATERRDMKVVPYFTRSEFTVGCWEYLNYRKKWERDPGRFVGGGPGVNVPGFAAFRCCHTEKQSMDFMVWLISEVINRYGFTGIYIDDFGLPHCYSQEHGCGWTGPDGNLYPTFPHRGNRLFTKRLRKIMLQQDKEPFIYIHSSPMLTASLSFADCLLCGEGDLIKYAEEHNGKWTPDYTLAMPPEAIKAEYQSDPLGLAQYWINQDCPGYDYKQDPSWSETGYGYMFTHGIGLQMAWANPKVITELFGAMKRFGLGDAEFVPHWNKKGFSIDKQEILLSAYIKKDKVLFAVMNPLDKEVNARIQFDKNILGLNGREIKAEEMRSKEAFVIDKDGFNVNLRAKGFKMIEVMPVK